MLSNDTPRQFYEKMPHESIVCELCQNKNLTEIFQQDRYGMGLQTVLCRQCGFIFTNPRPTREAISAFYQDGYRQFYTGSTEPDSDYRPESSRYRRAKRLVDFIKPSVQKFSGSTMNVLDIGCGSGVLLHIFQQAFPQSRLSGVEPDTGFGKYAESLNRANILYQDVEKYFSAPFSTPFDVILLNHVLEHLYQPFDKLLALRERLRPGGLLLVEVPHLLSGDWKDPLKIFHIAHVSHFTPDTLEKAFLRSGFKILQKSLSVPRTMTYLCQKSESWALPGAWEPSPEKDIRLLETALRDLCLKAQKGKVQSDKKGTSSWMSRWRQSLAKMKKEKPKSSSLEITPFMMYARMEKEIVPCNLCGEKNLEKFLVRDRYSMGVMTSLCRSCGFLFTNPRPTQKEMNEFYRTKYRKFYTGTTDPAKEYGEKLHHIKREWMADILCREFSERGLTAPRILEVGCGAGVLLYILRNKNPNSQLFGIEPYDVFAAHAAQQSGAQVFAADIDTFSHDHPELLASLDAIVLNHVLEHLYDPLDKIRSLKKFLKPEGYFLIQVPNLLSPHWTQKLPIFHIAHVNHFTTVSMRYLFARAGLKILKEISVSLPVHPKAMTYLVQAEPEALHSQAKLLLPEKKELSELFIQLDGIRDGALHTRKKNPLQRFLDSWSHQGFRYTVGRLIFYFGRAGQKMKSWISGAPRETKFSLRKGEDVHQKNEIVLRLLLQGQKVLILGSGQSASCLQEIPEDVKILTCNASVRLFAERGWARPLDLFLCRKKAMLHDYPDIESHLIRLRTHLLIMDDRKFIVNRPGLRAAYDKLLLDSQKDNYYLEKIIAPTSLNDLAVTQGLWNDVTWTSAGLRLLQYAIYFEAKEIYVAGIDPGAADYFWGGKFIHKHPIDINFLKLISERVSNIYSLSPSSPLTQYFPHRTFTAPRPSIPA